METGAYIIFSDVHLGLESEKSDKGEKCNYDEFCHFLEWIQDLKSQTISIKHNAGKVSKKSPSKIILLGDMLELWDPKDGDRDNVITASMRPFSLLSNINCDKIYVIGNHDDSLGELHKFIKHGSLDYKTTMDNAHFRQDNGTTFDIYNKHYPEKEEKTGILKGIKIGNKSYFFLHGQQFAKEQVILKYISQLIGENWNPLDWFQVLYNIQFTKNHWQLNFVIFLVLFLGGKYFLWNVFLQSSFWVTVLWATVTGLFALSSIPGIVAHTQGKIYNSTKPKFKTVKEVIEYGYYQEQKDNIDADVVVFGHTHFAGSYEIKTKTKRKLFLNSGCWVGEDAELSGKMRYVNTFIYLDESGAYTLRWLGSGRIECIEAFNLLSS